MEATSSSSPSKDLIFILDGFQETIHNNLYTFWKTSQLCDLTLQMSGGRVHVHSCLMAAFSPTIADMLSKLESYFNEKGRHSQKTVTIDLKEFSPKVVESIVSSIYTGKLLASLDNIKEILDAVRWLGIEHLVFAIEQTILEEGKLDKENKTFDTFNSSFKVVISNENVQSTFYEELNSNDIKQEVVEDSLESFTDTTLSAHKSSPTFLNDNQQPFLTSDDRLGTLSQKSAVINENHNNQNSKSQRLLENTSSSSTKLNEKNISDCSLPTVNVEISNLSCILAPTNETDFTVFNSTNENEMEKSTVDDTVSKPSDNTDINISKGRIKSVKVKEKENVKEVTKRKVLSKSLTDSKDSGVEKCQAENKRKKRLILKVVRKRASKTTSVTSANIQWDQSETSPPDGAEESAPEFEKSQQAATPLIKVENGVTTYKCQKCPIKFCDIDKYNEHINDHPEYPCTECGEIFYAKDMLTRHRFIVHLESKYLNCTECSFQASTTRQLCRHSLREHDQPKPFRCKYPHCLYRSDKFYIVEKHMERIHKDLESSMTKEDKVCNELLKCRKCCLKFQDIEGYTEHVNNHPVFACEDCPTKFLTKIQLTRHRYSVHLQKKFLVCNDCGFQARSTNELCRHSKKEHNQPKPFRCKYSGCSYQSHRFYLVENHIKALHEPHLRKPALKRFVCNNCGKAFSRSAVLVRHIRCCLRLEEFLCDICGEPFNEERNMIDHKNTVHLKMVRYKCAFCPKTFYLRSHYKTHLYNHSNNNSFSCSHCSKTFRFPRSLKKHLELVHAVVPKNKGVNLNYKSKNQTRFRGKRVKKKQ